MGATRLGLRPRVLGTVVLMLVLVGAASPLNRTNTPDRHQALYTAGYDDTGEAAASLTVADPQRYPLPGETAPPPAVHIAASGQEVQHAVRLDIADVLLRAYRSAAGGVPASCHLPVSLLAAIGQVESGSLVGYPLDAQHRTSILGPVLDGHGFAAVADTDHGRWDGNTTWDRAVGPMQFIPSTWARFGVDGDGDGVADPQDIEDASAATAAYLCYGARDLADPTDVRSAILSYNHSVAYLRLVLTYQQRYAALGLDRGGVVTGLPTSIVLSATPVGGLDGWGVTRTADAKQPAASTAPKKQAAGSAKPAGKPSGTPSGSGTASSPSTGGTGAADGPSSGPSSGPTTGSSGGTDPTPTDPGTTDPGTTQCPPTDDPSTPPDPSSTPAPDPAAGDTTCACPTDPPSGDGTTTDGTATSTDATSADTCPAAPGSTAAEPSPAEPADSSAGQTTASP